MQIPIVTPQRPPLELCEIKLYSTGLKGKFLQTISTSL